MGEAILVVRQVPIVTPDPTITIQTQNFESLVVRFTNTHDEEVVIYYEVDEPNDPDANQVTVAADSFEDRTITGLNSNTSYTVYAYAIEDGQRKSDVVGQSTSTQTYTTQAPTINVTNTETDEVTFTLKNNDTSTVTMYYEVDDSTPDITATVSGSATITRTIGSLTEDTNYTLYARAQASNENMSSTVSEGFKTNLSIVTQNLQVFLDAGNTSSYTSGSSTWFDLSGNGRNATIYSSPPFDSANGGSIDFDGSSDYARISNPNINFSSEQTIIMALKAEENDGNRRNPYNQAYGGYGTITHETSGSLSYYHGTAGRNASPYQGTDSGSGTLNGNEIAFIALVRNPSTVTWYKNGISYYSENNSYSSANDNGNDILIAEGYKSNFLGKIYFLMLYDRALSSSEIYTNYNFYEQRVLGQAPSSVQLGINLAADSCVQLRDLGYSTGEYLININGNAKQVYCDMDNNGGGWMLYASFSTDNDYSQDAITKPRMLQPEFNTYGFDLNYTTSWSDGVNGNFSYTRRPAWFAHYYSRSPHGQFTMTSYQGPTNVSEMRIRHGGGSTSYSGPSGYVLVNNVNRGTAPSNPTGTLITVAPFNPSGSTPLFRQVETGIAGLSDIWVR